MYRKLKSLFLVWITRVASITVDSIVMGAAYMTAFILRFDFAEPHWGWGGVASSFITVWLVQCAALWLFGCWRLVWRYISIGDAPCFVIAIGYSTVVLILLRMALPGHLDMRPPYSITFFNSFLVIGGLLGVRILWRLLQEGSFNLRGVGRIKRRARRILLVGAGSAGDMMARELKRQGEVRQQVVGFLDDDPTKQRVRIQGFAVLGELERLPVIVRKHRVDEVVISMVKVDRSVIRSVVRLCEQVGVPVRIVPGYYELIEGRMTASGIRSVDVVDILGRKEVYADVAPVVELFSQKRVVITGAGGSIGSELARQVLRVGPSQLVLVERSEGALYEIERELRRIGSEVGVVAQLADVGDRVRMEEVFAKFKPQIVIHAAAYKHVPLVEANAVEALKNNVFGTRVLGELALKHRVERFVLISTDKAVRPVSVMGATKRMAEIALQGLNGGGETLFSAVRFGNVLDSSGSVVPLFREQIRRGEAVTVTHPEMQRYFMTIAEAVSLVLQAAALAEGGEVFVLDMGEPVKIADLATEMILLSGLRPHEDIPIVFTGIRPGEKLFEELDVSERSAYRTGHARIFISKIRRFEQAVVKEMLESCRELVAGCGSSEQVMDTLRRYLGGDGEEDRGGEGEL